MVPFRYKIPINFANQLQMDKIHAVFTLNIQFHFEYYRSRMGCKQGFMLTFKYLQ